MAFLNSDSGMCDNSDPTHIRSDFSGKFDLIVVFFGLDGLGSKFLLAEIYPILIKVAAGEGGVRERGSKVASDTAKAARDVEN
jgi:hypothetical protein